MIEKLVVPFGDDLTRIVEQTEQMIGFEDERSLDFLILEQVKNCSGSVGCLSEDDEGNLRVHAKVPR